jgi:hypothetical protein
MRTILLVLAFATTAAAGQYRIAPALPDPGGIPGMPSMLAPGSPSNPYVVHGPNGRVGSLHTLSPDMTPHDGFNEPGTMTNPWVLDTPNDDEE